MSLVIPPIANLNHMVEHQAIGHHFINNEQVFKMWMDFVVLMQGAHLHKRHLRKTSWRHIENVPILVELIQTGNIMWSYLVRHRDLSLEQIKRVLDVTHLKIVEWLDTIKLRGGKIPNGNHLTFNLPLHRYYSVFLYKGIFQANSHLADVLTQDQSFLVDLLGHPLQIQIGLTEIGANLWPNETENLRLHKYFYLYMGTEAYKSLIDVDMFLIQCIASQLDADVFMNIVLDRFRVLDICEEMMSGSKSERIKNLDESQKMQLCNGALIFIATLVKLDICLDFHDTQSIKNEIIQFLCFSNCSFKDILRNTLPSQRDTNVISSKELEKLVSEVATFTTPDYTNSVALKTGKYVLKDHHWIDSYDPLFYKYYRSNKTDSEDDFERYKANIKSKNLFPNTNKLWPPYRLPSIDEINKSKLKPKYKTLQSKSLHSVLFVLLLRRLQTDSISDETFSLVIYLIEFAVHTMSNQNETNGSSNGSPSTLADDKIEGFKSNSIIDNLCQMVTKMRFIQTQTAAASNVGVGINESMISLLIKLLLHKSQQQRGSELFQLNSEVNASRVGDEHYFISNLLNKVAKLSGKCGEIMNETLKLYSIPTDPTDNRESLEE